MDYPNFIISNQKEESISIERVNPCYKAVVPTCLWFPYKILEIQQ